jgi:arsenate reductase
MKRVLFLCTGNSCRSQMAESILNKLGQGDFEAVSAGAKPAGFVHPLAIRVLKEFGCPSEGLRSKSWDEFKDEPFDTVVTVCDNAKESCPVFPGNAERIHWSFEDPVEASGTEEEKLAIFRKVFNEIQQRIRRATFVLSRSLSDRLDLRGYGPWGGTRVSHPRRSEHR